MYSKIKKSIISPNLLSTSDKSTDEIESILRVASSLKRMNTMGENTKIFTSGMAISLFRDHSTRTRYSFQAAANLLGLAVQEIDEDKSQVQHGESVHETFTMLSFLTRAIGIRDDIYLGKGHRFMKKVLETIEDGYQKKILSYLPTLINLQSDVDHPTQSLSDLLHLSTYFGGIDKLKGKKLVMSWAYSPTYGKPLSVPQGIISLLPRFGMNVTLAYPKEYNLIPDIEDYAYKEAKENKCSFNITHNMKDAFKDADIVYPKSWAPYEIMKERSTLLEQGNLELKQLEKKGLEMNAKHRDWVCNEKIMSITNNALYMHCLPADITGINCKEGEVESSIFDRFRSDLYTQASYKPYVIAAVILLSQSQHSTLPMR